jgi:transposase
MSNDTRIAVDVAKAVLEIGISDRAGHVSRRERLPRGQFLAFMAQPPAATVAMEACGSAHYWGRKIQSLGAAPHCPSRTSSAPTHCWTASRAYFAGSSGCEIWP